MTDREQFIATMTTAGLPLGVIQTILRNATTIERSAELACSSEAADRDRVPCPMKNGSDTGSCLCRDLRAYGCNKPDCAESKHKNEHGKIPRHEVQSWRAEQRIRDALKTIGPALLFDVVFQGDPRGYTTRILRPGDRRGEQYSDGVGVPVRVR